MYFRLRTYMLWKDGKYQGKFTHLGMKHTVGLGVLKPAPDIGRRGQYTWSRVLDPSRMMRLSKLNMGYVDFVLDPGK